MKCKQIKANLADYLHNRLDPEMSQTIHEHLTTCQDCSCERDFLQAYFGQLPKAEPMTVPADFLAQVRSKTIDARPNPKWRFSILRLLPAAGITSALALGCLLFFLVLAPHSTPLSENMINPTRQEQPDSVAKIEKSAVLSGNSEQPKSDRQPVSVAETSPAVKPAEPSLLRMAIPELAIVLKVITLPSRKAMPEMGISKSAAELFEAQSASAPAPAPTPAPSNPADPQTRLLGLIQKLGGQVITEEYVPDSKQLQKIIFTLPTAKYGELSTGLAEIGQFEPLPSPPTDVSEMLRFSLNLEY